MAIFTTSQAEKANNGLPYILFIERSDTRLKIHLKLLEEYVEKSNTLLEKLCSILQIARNKELYNNLIDIQTELPSLLIDEKWKVRLHGVDIAFISDSSTVEISLIDSRIITMSFFHHYLQSSGKCDINTTMSFFENLTQSGYAVQIEPLNGYQYMLTL